MKQKEMKARESELRHIQKGWEIREEDIKLIKKIGSGSYANVYRGEWEPLDGTPVAIKVLNITPATSQKSFSMIQKPKCYSVFAILGLFYFLGLV